MRPAKTQISLGIRPVWSESSLCSWRQFGSIAINWAHNKGSDQTGRMCRLIWVFATRTRHFVGFVMRWLNFHLFLLLTRQYCSCCPLKELDTRLGKASVSNATCLPPENRPILKGEIFFLLGALFLLQSRSLFRRSLICRKANGSHKSYLTTLNAENLQGVSSQSLKSLKDLLSPCLLVSWTGCVPCWYYVWDLFLSILSSFAILS